MSLRDIGRRDAQENLFAAFLLFIAISFGLLQLAVGLTNDTELLLHSALFMFEQGGFYKDAYELNTPAAIAIYALPGIFIKSGLLSPALALKGFIFLLGLSSLALLRRSLALGGLHASALLIWTAGAACALFIAPALCEAYGDRDHIFYLFALPWLAQKIARGNACRTSAILAGLGFCLRPQYAILFVVIHFFTGGFSIGNLRARLFSFDVFAVGIIGLLYVAGTVALFPSYVFDLVPQIALTYSSISPPWLARFNYAAFLCASGMASSLLFSAPDERRLRAASAVAACIVFLSVGGWMYTLVHLLIPLTLLLTALATSSLMLESLSRGIKYTCAALAIVIILFATVHIQKNISITQKTGHARNYNAMPENFTTELRQAAGAEFVMLSYALWGSNLATFDDTHRHVFAFSSMWTLPWILMNPDHPRAPALRAFLDESLIRSLTRNPQPSIVVDLHWQGKFLNFFDGDILKYFKQNPEIATLLEGYYLADHLDICSADPDPALPARIRAAMLQGYRCAFEVWKPLNPAP